VANLARVSTSRAEYDQRLVIAGDELTRLVRRLRNLSPLARTARRDPIVFALRRLAELDALAEQRSLPEPPDIDDHAHADALAVIGGDAIAALRAAPNTELLDAVLAEVRSALAATS
jgi:hypothetical protein